MPISFSIIIPCFNEAPNIEKTLHDLLAHLKTISIAHEVIVVNDGSTDASAEILKKFPVHVVQHAINRGYGASLKTGSLAAQYDWLLFYDADGQHKPEHIDDLLREADNHDMVVGAREGYQGPMVRQPGKKIVKLIAQYLSDARIPDLNSGFRLVRKSIFNEFINLYPDGFSLSTTITIALLKNHYRVSYVPIRINKRLGKSTVKWSDMLGQLVLISRLIVLFSPLRLFITIAGILFAFGFISLINDILAFNLNESTYFLITTSLIIFSFGLLADQLSEIRKRLR